MTCPGCQSQDTKHLPRLKNGRVISQVWAFYRASRKAWDIYTRWHCRACLAVWLEPQ